MVEAYTELFKQKELLKSAEINVETHKDINNKIQERIDSGVGANSELEQSLSRLALAESNLIVQMNNYEDAVTNFIKYMVLLFTQMIWMNLQYYQIFRLPKVKQFQRLAN